MIVGIGNDIVDVRRIEKTLNKSHGEAFKKRVFTPNEIQYCEKMANSSPHYAARWAVKEAFYKALPEEIQPSSHWRAVEIVREEFRKPSLAVVDDELCDEFKKRGYKVHHSISHEKEFCTAMVIIEQV